MNIRLQYPPTPEHAVKHAQIAVDAAWNAEQIQLDFAPQSLAHVDRIIGHFHAQRLSSEQILMLVFCFGCYFGEIFVRNHGAVWKLPADTTVPAELQPEPHVMVVEFSNGDIWNPIGKAFKLLENGEVDSLAYSYHVALRKVG
jgi:hypothetical protein